MFLMCDSMDGRVLDPTSAVYQRLSMPNLRALANHGVNFVRNYAASPQCVPSRTTMFTSRRIDETRTFSNEMGFALNIHGQVDSNCKRYYNKTGCEWIGKIQSLNQTILDVMERLGYDVHLIGKIDVGAGIKDLPSQANATADGFHNGPGLVISTRSANIAKATKKDPLSITNDQDNHVHSEDFKITQKCMDFLNSKESKNTNKPWMLYCSINIPHPPFQTNASWLEHVKINDIPLPPWQPENSMHPADVYMSKSKSVWRQFTNDEIMKVRKTYYAMNVETDYLLGRVWNTAIKNGFDLSNTIVVFVSDHGEMNMEHRQVWKNSLYEPSSRVPLFVAGPNIRQGVVQNNLTSLLDVIPTLVDLVGGTIQKGEFSGISLEPLLNENKPSGKISREFVTSQYHSNMGNTGSYMVRSGPWKYITFGRYLPDFAGYEPQLFNLDDDPDEVHDISKQNPSIVSKLHGMLTSLYDPQEVDKLAKTIDLKVFNDYFWDLDSKQTLMKKFGKAYRGFNSSDYAKVEEWRKSFT